MVLIETINVLWCASNYDILMSINGTVLLFYGALLLREEMLKRKASQSLIMLNVKVL